MFVGRPAIKNVIDIDYNNRMVKLQSPGHFGSFWTPFNRCMNQYEIDWFYIQEAAAEVKRLEIKRTIMENRLKPRKLPVRI